MNNKIEIARLPAEKQVRLARDVLERLNHPEDPQDTIRNILRLIRQATGFEAVGLRLQEGDDFPYFETSGFPRHFVLAERYLCERTEAGGVLRDSRGNPVLECMCGNVIRGRTNPSKPFFTRGGSFWTNCTTELLASTTVEDRKARTRNRCNGEGYESVALIPLRSDGESIGLLQLNDRRRDLFTEEMIQFLEGLGASIGIALARKRADEQVQALNTRLAETEEAERKRFAQVLHDEVGQDLTTLGLNLNLVRDALSGAPPPVLGRFDDSIRLVEGVAGRIRRFMEDLHPAVLEDYGLAAAINWYLDHFAKRTRIRITRTLDTTAAHSLPLAASTHVIRIVQEALNNTAQHAMAASVFVSLTDDGDDLHVIIVDDGKGFDPAECHGHDASPHFGLLHMRKRAEMAGGRCIITSAPERGTRVEIHVPITAGE